MPFPQASRTSPREERGGTLAGVLIGLVVGALVAVGIAWYINRTPVPFQDRLFKPESAKPGDAAGTPRARPAPQEPLALPGKPGDKPIEKPRFDFYKILPRGEEAAPAPSAEPRPAPVAPQLYLQLGTFQDPADADNLKARLALTGIEASVQQVILPDRGTVHRVRLGPFATPEEMNRMRAQLAAAGIGANVAKGGGN
ncbi:MAG: hypothetical protein AUK49_05230 [Betaproteobacteria bacterium CG2_30_68_42]|nr:MAG: hypothetical protein AUK49_05230 [Betaproteobacteria bacterium CG2_30_68_42]